MRIRHRMLGSASALSITIGFVSTALAHPGHGNTDPNALAHVSEPLHMLVAGLSLVVGFAGATILERIVRKRST